MAIVSKQVDSITGTVSSLLGLFSSFRRPRELYVSESGSLCIRTDRGELIAGDGVVAINDLSGKQIKVVSGFKGKIICKAVEAFFDRFERNKSKVLFGDIQRSVTQYKEFESLNWEKGEKVSIQSQIGHLKVIAFPSKYEDRDTSWSLKVIGFRGTEVSRLVLPYDSPLDYYFGGKYQEVQLRSLVTPQGIVIDYDKAYREALIPPPIKQKKSRPTGLVSFLKNLEFLQLHVNGDHEWIIGAKDPSFFESRVRITSDGINCLFENEFGSQRLGKLTSKAIFRYLKFKGKTGVNLEHVLHIEAV